MEAYHETNNIDNEKESKYKITLFGEIVFLCDLFCWSLNVKISKAIPGNEKVMGKK